MRQERRRGHPKRRPPGDIPCALRFDTARRSPASPSPRAAGAVACALTVASSGARSSAVRNCHPPPTSTKWPSPSLTAILQRLQHLLGAVWQRHQRRQRAHRHRFSTGKNDSFYEANSVLERVVHARRLPCGPCPWPALRDDPVREPAALPPGCCRSTPWPRRRARADRAPTAPTAPPGAPTPPGATRSTANRSPATPGATTSPTACFAAPPSTRNRWKRETRHRLGATRHQE